MNHIFIIAEAGVNHNGRIEIAKQLVDEAVQAGADAVKFQLFRAQDLVCKDAVKANYQLEMTNRNESQFLMLRRLELSWEMYQELFHYCLQKNILFLASPFDIESARLLAGLGLKIIKIPSGEITNLPYLRMVGGLGKSVILSTGMSTLQEVSNAVSILKEYGTENITVLHCNTQYPTPIVDVNLKAMITMKEKLGIPVGYSDHTQGVEVSLAAAALGASVIEKHFTLSKDMEGPDHKASLDPYELRQMVMGIRKIELALGDGLKQVSVSEQENLGIVRKSIVARKIIRKGESFTEDNLTVKRPGTGMSPMKWDSVIGKTALKDYAVDEFIEL